MQAEFSELRSFVVLASTLHFGKASEQLFLSQPALSKKIRRLEQKVGSALFARTRRKVAVSEAGRVLLPRARKILDDLDTALLQARAAGEGRAGALRIGFGIASVSEILPRTILRFRKSYPHIELEMRDMSSPSQIRALLEGSLDVGILRLPTGHPELVNIPLFREHLAVVSSATIAHKPAEGLRGYRDMPFIFLSRLVSETFYDHALSLCRTAGFSPHIVQEASEMFTILNLVRAGMGVSLVPSSAVRIKVPGVRFHELGTKEAAWSIGIAWDRRSEKRLLVSRLVEVIQSVVRPAAR
jgi:DNA-binding transcriptional LysR family regulator